MLTIFVSAVCIILGIVALLMAFHAPIEKHAIAVKLGHRGAVCLGIGVTIALGYWLFRRLKD